MLVRKTKGGEIEPQKILAGIFNGAANMPVGIRISNIDIPCSIFDIYPPLEDLPFEPIMGALYRRDLGSDQVGRFGGKMPR
jgi:hypothetical protein